MHAAEIERNSRDYIIKNIVWTQELKMTSNFGQAWKDLPFNNIVHLVAYSNKNLAEISRKCRM
jgi:hypothetical protein